MITPESLAKTSEDSHQAAIFCFAALNAAKYPELSCLFAVPNGGRRDPREAAKLKATGTRAGVPDIILPVPRGKFAALYIELKVDNGRVGPEQIKWHERLRAHGNRVEVCYGWQSAAEVLLSYLT